MYVGRIVGVGRTGQGKNIAVYRVSSRSYPNRTAVTESGIVKIASREGNEDENKKSKYVEYVCVRVLQSCVVISNGSHTDAIADKIDKGHSYADALKETLADMGYEKDEFSTPRIAGVVPFKGDTGWLGTVREDGVQVGEVSLKPGTIRYIATYEHDRLGDKVFELQTAPAETAEQLAQDAISVQGNWALLELPVTAVAMVLNSAGKTDIATKDFTV